MDAHARRPRAQTRLHTLVDGWPNGIRSEFGHKYWPPDTRRHQQYVSRPLTCAQLAGRVDVLLQLSSVPPPMLRLSIASWHPERSIKHLQYLLPYCSGLASSLVLPCISVSLHAHLLLWTWRSIVTLPVAHPHSPPMVLFPT